MYAVQDTTANRVWEKLGHVWRDFGRWLLVGSRRVGRVFDGKVFRYEHTNTMTTTTYDYYY